MRNYRWFMMLLVLAVLGFASSGIYAETILLNKFKVTFLGRSYDNDADETTFTYLVSGTGVPPDLSHFDLEIPDCEEIPLVVVGYEPVEAVDFGVDPTTGVDGIKWGQPLKVDQERTYTITFAGDVPVGKVTTAVKGGDGFEAGLIGGSGCIPPLELVKLVSFDGIIWLDADDPVGEVVEPGSEVYFQFQISNNGEYPITALTLVDNVLDLSECSVPETLAADALYTCILGPLPAVQGLHHNVATVTGVYVEEQYTHSDEVYYFGGSDLLKNGSFELDLNQDKFPDDWKGVQLSRDKRVCNTGGKVVALDGQCAFRFKGVPGENAVLSQKLKDSDLATLTGDSTLQLTWNLQGKVVGGTRLLAKVRYVSETAGDDGVDKLEIIVTEGNYTEYTFSMSAELLLADAVDKIVVRTSYKGKSGKYYLDDLHLLQTLPESIATPTAEATGTATDIPPTEGAIPLPAPANERGS